MQRAALVLSFLIACMPAQATEAGWAQLREGGRVVLIRNANAPGSSNPATVEQQDCSGRRSLSGRGEQQARRMGALFAARAARTEKVLSSHWCQALETARLAFGAFLVEEFEPLDPAADEAAAEASNAAVLDMVRQFSGSGNLVMVTYGEKIEALTGFSPREAEAVIVAPEGEGLHVTGRIVFN